MKTKAVRIYGKEDLRLEEFELPAIRENEILARVVCDSICMSSYKANQQGAEHKRIPDDVHIRPTIIGHEFSGEIIEVGSKWKEEFHAGMKFSIQPAINYPDGPVGILSAPGYSYQYIGGDATHIIIPNEVMEQDCLLPYNGPGFYPAALAEPLSCVIGAMHANYHTNPGSYIHQMEIVDGGDLALLAGVGPMGLAAINYVIHREDRKPGFMVVTDIDQERLDRAATLYSPEYAATPTPTSRPHTADPTTTLHPTVTADRSETSERTTQPTPEPLDTPDEPTAGTPVAGEVPPYLLQALLADMAERLGLPVDQITVVHSQVVEWSDGSLGCPQPGMMYLQVLTPGFRVVLAAQDLLYDYHTDTKSQFILCNPDGVIADPLPLLPIRPGNKAPKCKFPPCK